MTHIEKIFESDIQNQRQKIHLPGEKKPILDQSHFFRNFRRNFLAKKVKILKLHENGPNFAGRCIF